MGIMISWTFLCNTTVTQLQTFNRVLIFLLVRYNLIVLIDLQKNPLYSERGQLNLSIKLIVRVLIISCKPMRSKSIEDLYFHMGKASNLAHSSFIVYARESCMDIAQNIWPG